MTQIQREEPNQEQTGAPGQVVRSRNPEGQVKGDLRANVLKKNQASAVDRMCSNNQTESPPQQHSDFDLYMRDVGDELINQSDPNNHSGEYAHSGQNAGPNGGSGTNGSSGLR